MRRFIMLVAASLSFIAAPFSTTAVQGRAASDVTSDHIARIENDFAPITIVSGEPPVRLNIDRLMQISNVPGLSVAVIDGNRIAWAKGYGVTETGGTTRVTTHTLFQAASISKPISAIAALWLVEHGKLRLDTDVNAALSAWKVPENAFTREQKVTLRRILTHTAGTTVHGFLGYAQGQPLPTIVQILDGTAESNNEPVRVDYVPGSKQRYSGGGVMIEQLLMTEATGESFPQLMRRIVFDPLHLKDSTFEQPLSIAHAAMAASGHEATGEVIPVKRNVFPEMAVGGLTTTPSDLAKIAIELALSKQGKANHILSAEMTREMLRLQVDPNIESLEGPRMRMGLGWVLGEPSEPPRFEHSGVNPGFTAQLVMMDSGHGVVVMANTWSFSTTCVVRYLINNIAKEYGWSYRVTPYTPWPYADTVLLATAKLRGAQAAITRYYELKKQWAAEKVAGRTGVVWANDPPDYPPNEYDLLGLAQTIGDAHHLDDAISIMNVEVKEFPAFPNAYATLAHLHLRAGNTLGAIEAYEKLLALQPDNQSVINAIKKLTEGLAPAHPRST